MKSLQHFRLEACGATLVVVPLFTFGRFAEGDLAAEWKEVLAATGGPTVRHVIIDLGEIPYFGSTLLNWIVQLWNQTKQKGGSLAICNASVIGREVLSTARLDIVLPIFDSRSEALASLATTTA